MTIRPRIPVAAPALVGNERAYVLDCLESSWISSSGAYLERFERGMAEYLGVRHALSCSNGTSALHLALLALGIGPEDEVIVPALTYVATANAVRYCGATPVFADSEPETWNLDPRDVEARVTPRTKAVIAVHLYGHPADMDALSDLCRRRGLRLVEDAAEALGARYRGRMVGGLSDVGTFSFYGNKIITTGEGGMVVTNDDGLAARVRLLKGQGMDPQRRYWFPIVGYNYRMTNVAAAIGLAQLEKIDWHIDRRIEVARKYANRLAGCAHVSMQREQPWARAVYWMSCAVLAPSAGVERDALMLGLDAAGIETRPFFCPLHLLPPYRSDPGVVLPVAEALGARGLNLPSFALLSDEEVEYVCDRVLSLLERAEPGSRSGR